MRNGHQTMINNRLLIKQECYYGWTKERIGYISSFIAFWSISGYNGEPLASSTISFIIFWHANLLLSSVNLLLLIVKRQLRVNKMIISLLDNLPGSGVMD